MKKHETLSRGEELLIQVLDECLEEDLSFVPPEREIARKHRFSEKFEQAIKELLENTSRETKKKEIQKHFSPRYGQWAACILLFFICGGLIYHVIGPFTDKSGAAVPQESASDEMAAETAESWEGEASAESLPAAGDTGERSEAQKQEKTYCGQTVRPAEQQDVPEALEHVTTLVNCPVQDEENPVLILTIGNTGTEDVQYLNRYDLEVWIDDGWYVIPAKSEEEEQWMTLEAGMAVDAEIDLKDYQMDYGARQYRLIAYVNQEAVSAEFTFEEVFTEMMEKLEEEEETSGE